MLAKVQAGATGYDIVFPSVHMHDIMAELDLLHKTDINQYQGFKNIDPAFLRAKIGSERRILPALCLGLGRHHIQSRHPGQGHHRLGATSSPR